MVPCQEDVVAIRTLLVGEHTILASARMTSSASNSLLTEWPLSSGCADEVAGHPLRSHVLVDERPTRLRKRVSSDARFFGDRRAASRM